MTDPKKKGAKAMWEKIPGGIRVTGDDLARNMLESPRLRNVRYTERQLKIIEGQWPEVGAELRRRQTHAVTGTKGENDGDTNAS